ncbi:hypothetical protein Pfo_022817 [Paulownia fortunei]|nr:hypothetical protein Pfo_022817 [Paulownia fortunei]
MGWTGEVQKMDPQNVGSGSEAAKHGWEWKQMGNEEKATAVHEEMRRRSRLPPNSSYASQLLRVLNKIIQLLSLQKMMMLVLKGAFVGLIYFV